MKILNILSLFTNWTLLLNFVYNIQFLQYYLLLLIIYGQIIINRNLNKFTNYYNVSRMVIVISHIITHYMLPFYLLNYYNTLENKLSLSHYLYGLFFGFLYFII